MTRISKPLYERVVINPINDAINTINPNSIKNTIAPIFTISPFEYISYTYINLSLCFCMLSNLSL